MSRETHVFTTRELAEEAIKDRRKFSPDFPWFIIVNLVVAIVDHNPRIENLTNRSVKKIAKEKKINFPNGYSSDQIINITRTWVSKVKSG